MDKWLIFGYEFLRHSTTKVITLRGTLCTVLKILPPTPPFWLPMSGFCSWILRASVDTRNMIWSFAFWFVIIKIIMKLDQDVCPWGHLFLGLVSLAPLLLPGLMYRYFVILTKCTIDKWSRLVHIHDSTILLPCYSLSTFVHYRGDLMQCGVGKPFNIPSAKLGSNLFYNHSSPQQHYIS